MNLCCCDLYHKIGVWFVGMFGWYVLDYKLQITRRIYPRITQIYANFIFFYDEIQVNKSQITNNKLQITNNK